MHKHTQTATHTCTEEPQTFSVAPTPEVSVRYASAKVLSVSPWWGHWREREGKAVVLGGTCVTDDSRVPWQPLKRKPLKTICCTYINMYVHVHETTVAWVHGCSMNSHTQCKFTFMCISKMLPALKLYMYLRRRLYLYLSLLFWLFPIVLFQNILF